MRHVEFHRGAPPKTCKNPQQGFGSRARLSRLEKRDKGQGQKKTQAQSAERGGKKERISTDSLRAFVRKALLPGKRVLSRGNYS